MQLFRGIFVASLLCLAITLSGCGGGESAPATPPVAPPAPPAAPQNLAALPGDAVVSLSWSASSGATNYDVLRSDLNGGPYAAIANEVTAASYSDSSVANGTTYYYVVQATNSGGTSANSNQVSATPSAELQTRVTANQQAFYVYKDADSGLNHGFASGWFVSPATLETSTEITKVIQVDSGCVEDPAETTIGCYPATATGVLDPIHGTVLRFTFSAQSVISYTFAGVNIEEPEFYATSPRGVGYDLEGVESVTFDVRSPDGAQVSFGVGGCTTPFTGPLPSTWITMTVVLSSLVCQLPVTLPHPDLSNVHDLFSVTSDSMHAPNGATVLLDNIQFTPVPARATQTQEGETLSLPVSNQAFGVVAQPSSPFLPDQANRNFAAIYEAALTIQSLINQGDTVDAKEVADALDYALHHDNQGDYLPMSPTASGGCFSGAPTTQCGLHDAYEGGDIALLNAQGVGLGTAQAGDSRLAGFTCGTSFCITQDTATGGNNGWAILALLDEYKASGDVKYLNDATTIGNWVIANLADNSGTGFGGYFVGFSQLGQAPPKTVNTGKSTENNADIFAAFTALAQYDTKNAVAWTNAANVAGDFVMRMFDSANGRFNTGTDPVGAAPGNGTCPTGATKGNDVINTNSSPDCDFLDSDTFTTLAMAGAPRYFNYQLPDGGTMDWRRPIQYVLNTFAQNIPVGNLSFQGFDIVRSPLSAADGTVTNGIAWEFTGQVVETMRYVDKLYDQTTFESQAEFYLEQIQLAQTSSPFGDSQGVVASTLQDGKTLLPVDQCLNTPFDNCPPERVGLAATNWMVLAEQQFNPLAGSSFSASLASPAKLPTPTARVTPLSTSIPSTQVLSSRTVVRGGNPRPPLTRNVTSSSVSHLSHNKIPIGASYVRGADLISEALHVFPLQTEYLEYDNLSALRSSPFYSALRQRFSGKPLEDARIALARLGVREDEVQEVVSGSSPTKFYSLVSGNFSEAAVAEKDRGSNMKLAGRTVHCSSGPMCIVFLEDSLAAIGRLDELKFLLEPAEARTDSLIQNRSAASLLTGTANEAPVRGLLLGGDLNSSVSGMLNDWTGWNRDWSWVSSNVTGLVYTITFDTKVHVSARLQCTAKTTAALLAQVLRGLGTFESPTDSRASQAPAVMLQETYVSASDNVIDFRAVTGLRGSSHAAP